MGHLTEMQRYTIQKLLEQKCTIIFIAETIGKDKSVISREIRRNRDQRSKSYNAGLAQRKYEKRMHEKPKHVRFTPQMNAIVDALLLQDYSPEQIKGRMSLFGIDMVSPERIYQYVWHEKKHGGELYSHLRRKGRRYRKRGSSKDSRGIIKDRVGIENRPEIVEKKLRFGDLEFDTIVGRNHKGALFTATDRSTLIGWIAKLPGKDSVPLSEAAVKKLMPFNGLLHTITSDNGKEFANHKAIAEALGVDFYFAHPYHSWERGANENMNGLIRQYIPKGASLEDIDDEYIEMIQERLNNRPRKKLGFLTPYEYFFSTFAKNIV